MEQRNQSWASWRVSFQYRRVSDRGTEFYCQNTYSPQITVVSVYILQQTLLAPFNLRSRGSLCLALQAYECFRLS